MASAQSFRIPRNRAAPKLAIGILVGVGIALLVQRPHDAPAAPRLPIAGLAGREPIATPYRNCAAARAAGHAPVYAYEPEFGPWLDADNDGIGCEPYPRP